MNYTKLLKAEKSLDGFDKVAELREAIGKITSVNNSPTSSAKLLSVSDEYCEFVSVASEYGNSKPEDIGKKFKLHNYLAHNAFFF